MARNIWRQAFIEALRQTANVSGAAQIAGRSRAAVYAARDRSEAFRKQWDDAIDDATDALELEARRRAFSGVEEPVYYQGQIVGGVRKYSDVLLIFLLKAHRPEKFRENVRVEGTLDIQLGAADNIREKLKRLKAEADAGADTEIAD